ncbi:MAG: hypothetical protein IKD58_00965 [Loktanella sp.]|nr:hypothetical protein [Loktanella sp.]
MANMVNVDLHLAQSRTLDDVVFQLQVAGYEIEDITRTFLGRLRIIALNEGTRREIIMSRSTGEIFSDTVSSITTTPAARTTGQSGTRSDNANPRSNERGGAANNNRGGGGGASNSNRGGGGNSSSNARRGSN